MTTSTPATPAAVDKFVLNMKAVSDQHFAQQYPSLTPSVFGWTKGRKYARVYRADSFKNGKPENASVVAFVDMTTGDVLRPAGWKAPSLRSRGRKGNVNDGSANMHVNPYGVGYL